jgi:predicted DNA-binding WGR domain protein
MSRREFQFVEGPSSKFRTIELSGSSFTVNWGRIGTNGQSQTKEFSSDAEASKQYEKLVAEKLKKGYTEVGGGAAVAFLRRHPRRPQPGQRPRRRLRQ